MNAVFMTFPRLCVCQSMDKQDNLRKHRYQITRRLGSGGQADVYEALDLEAPPDAPRKVAIKYSKAEPTDESNGVSTDAQRFMKEALIASEIKHPNVIQVTDFGLDPETNSLLYVMEYVKGGITLSDLINDRRSSAKTGKRWFPLVQDFQVMPIIRTSLFDIESELVAIFVQILDGVSALHAAGIIHRDLKATNVLIRKQQGKLIAILADFGIARCVSAEARMKHGGTLTAAETIVGTPNYMSPQQFMRKKGEELDELVDVWAAACLLYEMITGARPFDDPNDTSLPGLQQRIIQEDPVPLSAYVTAPNKALEAVIMKGLEKDPRNRIQSMAEFRQLVLEVCAMPSGVEQVVSESSIPTMPEVEAAFAVAAPMAEAERPIAVPAPEPAVDPVRVSQVRDLSHQETQPPEQARKKGSSSLVMMAGAVFLALAGGGIWMASRSSSSAETPAAHAPPIASSATHPSVASTAVVSSMGTATVKPVLPTASVSAKRLVSGPPAAGTPAAKDWKKAQDLAAGGKYAFAATYANMVLAAVPDFAEAEIFVGDCKRKLGKVEEACKSYANVHAFENAPTLSAEAQAFVGASCKTP